MSEDCVYMIVMIIAVIVLFVVYMYRFFKMPSDEQLEKVKEWLLFAVTKAEKEMGAGTGKIKLRYVYDMFVEKFTWLAKIITFDMFSMMVDEALLNMREILEKNKAVRELVEERK